jgi:uncharacterized protein (DUF4415 family)
MSSHCEEGGAAMKHYKLEPNNLRQLSPEEEFRLDSLPIDYSDIPELGPEFFAKALVLWPSAKEEVTIRLDIDVLQWSKSSGQDYEAHINRILRAEMKRQKAATHTKTEIPHP